MGGGKFLERARSGNPFADRAQNSALDKLLLNIAIQHGIEDVKDVKGHRAALEEVQGMLGEDVIATLRQAAADAEKRGVTLSMEQLLQLYLPTDKDVTAKKKPKVTFY